MKKKEIIDKILQYHPNIEHYHGCDESSPNLCVNSSSSYIV